MEKVKRTRETETRVSGRAPNAKSRRRWFWIVTRTVRGRLQIMPTRLPGHRRAFAVFSFEEEARMFLRLSGVDPGREAEGGWRIQKTDSGTLASALLHQDKREALVTLDPLTVTGAEPMNVLASIDYADFMGFLLRNEVCSQPDVSWAAF